MLNPSMPKQSHFFSGFLSESDRNSSSVVVDHEVIARTHHYHHKTAVSVSISRTSYFIALTVSLNGHGGGVK